MSERWAESAQPAQAAPAIQDGVTAGALLREAREAAGLHVAALAVSLKVPVRKLEALEDNRWDLLTDLVFVRALASSVCRTLKIDPHPILERLPQMAMPRLVRTSDGINTPFRSPGDGAPPTWIDQMTKPVFLAVFALLLGALVLILLPRTQQESGAVGTVDTASVESVPTPQPIVIPTPVSEPAPEARAVAVAANGATPLAAPAAAPASASAGVNTSAGAVSRAASAPGAAAGEPASAASGIVVFHARGASWIQVTDGKGVTTVRKELQAGEAAGASGVLPLQVTVGRVDQTDVRVRGKPFDMGPVSKDNVARFTIK